MSEYPLLSVQADLSLESWQEQMEGLLATQQTDLDMLRAEVEASTTHIQLLESELMDVNGSMLCISYWFLVMPHQCSELLLVKIIIG